MQESLTKLAWFYLPGLVLHFGYICFERFLAIPGCVLFLWWCCKALSHCFSTPDKGSGFITTDLTPYPQKISVGPIQSRCKSQKHRDRGPRAGHFGRGIQRGFKGDSGGFEVPEGDSGLGTFRRVWYLQQCAHRDLCPSSLYIILMVSHPRGCVWPQGGHRCHHSF